MASSKKFALVGVLALGCLFWTALTPQQIVVNAGVFGGFADRYLEQSDVYLLATIAGVAINPANILSNAAGFGDYSDRQLQEAQTYLLSQINTTGGGIPGLYVTGTGTGTTNGDKTITINVTASGSGLPGTNTVVTYGGDPATASQTQWLAVANGTTYDTNKAGNSVILSNGNVSAVTFSLPASGGKITGATGSTLFEVDNASGQIAAKGLTNADWVFGTNNQFHLDTSGNLTLSGTAHGIWGLHVDGSAVSNAVAASTTTAQTVFTNPWLAGNVTQTNGTYLATNYTGAGKDWYLLSGSQLYGSNGTYQASFTLNPTNLALGGAAINAGISFGGGNGLSNTFYTGGGSNDINVNAGYQTNNAKWTNGNFYLLDAAFFRNSLGVAGPVVVTNNVTINGSNWVQGTQTITGASTNQGNTFNQANVSTTGSNWVNGTMYVLGNATNIGALNVGGTLSTTGQLQTAGPFFTTNASTIGGGAVIVGIQTNQGPKIFNTNALTWSTIQATNEFTFWAFATNVTIAGWQNIDQSHMYHGWTAFSNGASGNITVTWPAGTRLLQGYTTNQPLNTCTITNSKVAIAEWWIWSHLGQSLTNVEWKTQSN